MKRLASFFGLMAALAASSMERVFAQACPLCKLSLIQSPEGRHIAKAFNHGILFLLAMPYLVGGLMALALFFLYRKRSKEVLCLGLILCMLGSVSHAIQQSKNKSLPVLGQVPEFQLVDQNGKPLSEDKFKGDVWVADFIYTRCSDECPLLSARMAKLQSEFKDFSHVALVSFTIDPAYDKPPVLKSYAKRFGAVDARWHFVTGASQVIRNLGEKTFHMPAVKNSNQILGHSNFLILVDGQGKIRGYYDSSRPELLKMLVHDALALAHHST